MKTRCTALAVKAAMVAGLAAALAFASGVGGAGAHHTDVDNFFELHPGPLSGRTGIDPHDPYAPVDLSESGSSTDGTGNARVAAKQSASSGAPTSEWSSTPRLPGQPF